MNSDIEYILFNQEKIAATVARLAEEINTYYREQQVTELIVLGILNGAVVFYSDLLRQLDLRVRTDFMRVSSYGAGTVSGELKIKKDADLNMAGQHVLVVEDIIDTGKTLYMLRDWLKQKGALSVKLCSFLDKPSRRTVEIQTDFTGHIVPDVFVVGYGLDYNELYRNLPYIGVLKREIYHKCD